MWSCFSRVTKKERTETKNRFPSLSLNNPISIANAMAGELTPGAITEFHKNASTSRWTSRGEKKTGKMALNPVLMEDRQPMA
jgi:hypothetical protein